MTQAAAVQQVGAGDHVCLTFSDPEERLDLVAAFVKDGLRMGQRVLCWTDAVPAAQLLAQLSGRTVRSGAAARRGQLRVSSVQEALLRAPDAEAMVGTLAGELELAMRDGYTGVRVAADMCWATRPGAPVEHLMAFETQVAGLFTGGRLAAVCQYDRDRFDAVTLASATAAHPKTVAAQVYYDTPLLRICRQYSPGGVRIAGELDFRHHDILEQALGESRRLDRHMHINLSHLEYIDAACAAAIVNTGVRLPASRRLSVICHGLVATMMELAGAHKVPQLRVQLANGQP